MSSRKQFRYNNRKCRSTGYNMLIQIAINLNIADAIYLLRQNLQEEEEMFRCLRANASTIYL